MLIPGLCKISGGAKNSAEDPAAAFQLWLQPRLRAAVCYLKQKGTLHIDSPQHVDIMWTSCEHHVNPGIKQKWCGQTTSDGHEFVTGYLEIRLLLELTSQFSVPEVQHSSRTQVWKYTNN